MRFRFAAPVTALATLAALATSASAHDVKGRISASGLEFLEAQIPTYIPKSFEPPEFEKDVLCMDAVQRNTTVELEIHDFQIFSPRNGALAIDIELSAVADGDLFIDDPYACLGEASCKDHIEVHNARAIMEFELMVEGGEPRVMVSAVDLMIGEDDIVIEISDCAIEDVLESIADFAREWFLDYLLGKVEDAAREKVGPLIEEMIGGFSSYEGSISYSDFVVSFEELGFTGGGVHLGADVEISSRIPADECVGEDPGEPSEHQGAAPALDEGVEAHIGLSLNFGLIDDVLYHVWRSGLTCVTDDHLAALGADIDLDHITHGLPSFPTGTEFSMAARLDQPPRVKGAMSEDLEMTFVIEGAEIRITGRKPSGEESVVHLELDADVTGVVGINPQTNALGLHVQGVELRRMFVDEDQVGAAEIGFDVARMRQVMEEHVMPEMLEEMGELPITGAVFNVADYALILKDLETTQSHLALKADLFRAPEFDDSAPDTSIDEHPARIVRPEEAVLLVSGTDAEIPAQLLQFEVTVDGEAQKLTYVRSIKVGGHGETGTYQVGVAAVDLHGNVDPTPAEVEVTVDGVAPSVATLERLRRLSEPGPVGVAWSASDDLTAAEELSATVVLYRLTDPEDALAVSEVSSTEVPAGQHAAEVEVPGDGLYRIEVQVEDEAGNESATSMLVEVKGGGCRAAGAGAGAPFALALAFLFALVALRRRR